MSLEPCKFRQANGWSRQSLLRIAIAAIVLALVALAGFGRLTRHPGDLLVGTQREGRNDLTDAFLAYRQFPQASAARFGSRGAWNPFSMAGRPWVGNPQSALHYPLHWLTDRTPTAALLSWVMVWHHFWGGLGVYFLCRIYGLERGALVGGAVFLLAPYWVAQTGEGHFNQVILVAWVPWTLMALERLRRAGRGGVSLLALMLGFFGFRVEPCSLWLWRFLCLPPSVWTDWRVSPVTGIGTGKWMGTGAESAVAWPC